MVDMQNHHDDRNIPIDQVGVSDLRYPIIVLDKKNKRQQTIANISMSVNLPHNFKGTHMSRFIEILNKHRSGITMATIPGILHDLKKHLKSESGRLVLTFPYFLERSAPVSKAKSLMEYECAFTGESNGEQDDLVFGVKVPVTSLCPCSKALSDGGAHNQRGYIKLDVRACRDGNGKPRLVWIEELIDIAERSASAPVYSLLKRSDEKFVTEQAYNNPVFVEDMVRNVAFQLKDDPRISWYRITAINHESIHNHSAFATVQGGGAHRESSGQASGAGRNVQGGGDVDSLTARSAL